jgi:hypothetical protein
MLDNARGQADDPAPVPHPPGALAHAVEGPGQVDRDQAPVVLVGHLGKRSGLADARIVDEHVDGSEAALGGVEQRPHAGRFGNVGTDGLGTSASRDDSGHDGRRLRAAGGVVDDHREPVGSEARRDRRADALGGTGHDGSSVCFGHQWSPSIRPVLRP